MKFIVVTLLFCVFQISESSKILIIHTTLTKSHLLPVQVLARALAEEINHDVTFLSAFPIGKNITNLREFAIPYDDDDKKFMYKISANEGSKGFFNNLNHISKINSRIGNNTLQMKEMQNLMMNEKFDLFILGYYTNEYMLGLGDHFKCPTVLFSSYNMLASLHRITGNPFDLASNNHLMTQGLMLDFRGRVKNFLMYGLDFFIIKNIYERHGKEVYRYNFPSTQYRSYSESLRNVSLLLLNSHFSTSAPRPFLPNVVEVGGLHVKSNPSPLPQDIKDFLDDSKHGAIYFSLGSKVDISHFTNKTMEIILNVFSKLNQRVIMKWGSSKLHNKPDNVYIDSWLPQDDILAHPNIKIFISHCGIGSVVESKYHGVPIIATPLIGDQFGNAKKVVNEGWCKVIDLKSISEEELMSVIKEVLNNPSYTSTVKRLSALQKDRPQDAKALAIYWIEYVIRHNGAPHLHYPAADLNILQVNSLDVIGFLLICCYFMYKVIVVAARIILKLFKIHKMKILKLLLLIFMSKACASSNILIIQTSLTKSHTLPLYILSKALVQERNHKVTFVTPFPSKENIEDLREIAIPYNESDKEILDKIAESTKDKSFIEIAVSLSKVISKVGNNTLHMKEMKNLKETEKFDVLILGYNMNEFMLGLGDHFKCPTIIFSPSAMLGQLDRIIGNPFSLASSNHFVLHGKKLDFIGRLRNFLLYAYDFLIITNIFDYYGKSAYSYNFPSTQYRSYSESLRNVSLLLLNSHFSTAAPRPYLPNVVEVGGLHVMKESSLLPKNIKEFLDDANDGAILFSLGSKVDISHFSNETMEIILNVFSKLNQRVIMKWGSSELHNKPDNVYIDSWLPQNDILAHPNVKLFMSHCGIGGIMEAKYHGVPIIGTPLYIDQFGNARKVENEGWGKVIDLKSTSEEELMAVIKEVLGNPSYTSTIKRMSALQKDRPQDAKALAIYWTEYIIRHNGAPHLHYPAADLNILQVNSLDVIGFLLICCYLVYKVIVMAVKRIVKLRMFCIKSKVE
ncbi:uncharacterized protein [Chironomus tepperi]|uniref:uncharacterized protein n=1 Tax=Chironomus tepperi TaxID=113505 RepID=UPI00391EF2D6